MNTTAIHYRVAVLNPHAHLFEITLTVPAPAAAQVLALPVWIPGSYLVREFSQHLQHLSAQQHGQAVALTQLDKHRWQLNGHQPGQPVTVRCEVYAFDASVRTAYLDDARGFFNGTSLCLRVVGQEDRPHHLQVDTPVTHPDWQLATALDPVQVDDAGFGTYSAPSYAVLVDTPVEMGAFWSAHFDVRGVPHRFVVSGAGPWLDGERLVADTRRICEAEMDFWHGPADNGERPPFNRYLFMLAATHDGYGGLEHHNSTALICPRGDLPRPHTATALKATDGHTGLLGLISHEYFHTWNVKRLRPAEFATHDLDRENHTELLWFFEGFTSYFDDLLLHRAGLIDTPTHLQLLAKTTNQVAQTPGRLVQTVAQASFDAWTRYYRIQENTPNATVSYYTKGALVALCLDLTLRQHGSSLDHALRALWHRCQGGPMAEADLRAVLASLAGQPLDTELDAWVHSTAELPVAELLKAHGVQVDIEPAPLAQRLGLRVAESNGITLKNVLRGGPAEQAGMASGDEWLAVECAPGETWRIAKLDDIAPLLGTRPHLHALVSRDRRVLRLPLAWPQAGDTAPGQTVVKFTPGPAATATPSAWPARLG
ncbi:MAG: peptidase M61 [Burkholderiaceae bacterium]